MRIALPVLIVVATAALLVLGLIVPAGGFTAVGTGSGSALPGLTAPDRTPEQAVANLLRAVQRKDWQGAYSQLGNRGRLNQSDFIRDLAGSNGSLRTLSALESWDLRPLHATDHDAKIRATLHWATAVGVLDEAKDLQAAQHNGRWRVLWPPPQLPNVPAQVIPVNYLRWDLVSSSAQAEWGHENLDAPQVRIISMNAVEFEGRSVVMGEVVNEDTIPAFVNVNATLVDKNGNVLGQESSFDKIVHVLLPKQVSPYRIDFPGVALQRVKNVRMDVKATLTPASADPVIGVMDQQLTDDARGRKVLQGQLLDQSGLVVNIPHVIATFYDNNGKVIWVSDGYVDRALFPQIPEPFAVEVPASLAPRIQNYHVVVNQYSIGKS
jgi:hypothetical protein